MAISVAHLSLYALAIRSALGHRFRQTKVFPRIRKHFEEPLVWYAQHSASGRICENHIPSWIGHQHALREVVEYALEAFLRRLCLGTSIPLTLQSTQQLQPPHHRPRKRSEQPHLLFAEVIPRRGAKQAQRTDGVPARGDERRARIEADAVVHAEVLFLELFGGQEVGYT